MGMTNFKNSLSESWVDYLMGQAFAASTKSKDPNKKVGCLIVDAEDKSTLSTGFNGFPRGVSDNEEKYLDREFKLLHIVHAEANAICSAAKHGRKLSGSILFVTEIPPCTHCAGLIIQAGISGVYCFAAEPTSKWFENSKLSVSMLMESGIFVNMLDRNKYS